MNSCQIFMTDLMQQSQYCFHLTIVPMRKEETFRDYGTKEVKVIGLYFGYEKDEVLALEAEWVQFKYHLEKLKSSLTNCQSISLLEYYLHHLLEVELHLDHPFPC